MLPTTFALTVLAFGCGRSPSPAAQKPGPPQPKTVRVEVGTARQQTLEKTLSLPATLTSDETALLHPRVEAYVSKVLVDIGEEVEAGQVLIQLSAPELRQAAQQQQAMLGQLKASEKVLLAELTAARAQLDVIGAQLKLKQSERDRRARLVSTGAIANQLLEETEAALQSTSAMLAKYQNAVEIVEAKLSQGEAEMVVGKSKLEQAQTIASYLELKAPFAGVIAERNVDPGNLVRPTSPDGNKPLLVLAKVDKLRAMVHATTDVAAQLSVGQQVEFAADDVPGKTFIGTLSRMAGTYNQKTRMMQAEIDLENSVHPATGNRPLRAGSYGAATIVLQSANLPVIPASTLRTRGDRTSVAVVRDGACLMTPVTVAFTSGDKVAIAAGIADGDQVVASPADVQDEQLLKPSEIKLINW